MPTSLRVLILEDSPTEAEVMVHHLREAGYVPEWRRVETGTDYLAHLEPSLDLLLIDYNLPDITAPRALQLLRERGWDVPAIVVTGTVSEEVALLSPAGSQRLHPQRSFAITIAIIFLCPFVNINAQQVNTEWVINNFTGFPVGVMIGLDNNENVFVAGQSGDHTKIIITKYDTNGNLIWERFYSIQDLGVVATWLSVDPTGNVIVTGYPRTFRSNPVETGLLTLKYDNNGNLLWDKLISGTWAFTVRSIVDLNGNIYVTGRAWQYTATYDFVTVKYAPDGTQLWFDTFDQNSGFHTPTSMELDQSNNLFITGAGQSGGLITVM